MADSSQPSDPSLRSAAAASAGKGRVPRLLAPALSDLPVDRSPAVEGEPVEVSYSPEHPVALPPEEDRHARTVLRGKPGDSVTLFDGRGRVATARLASRGEAIVSSLRLVPRMMPQLTVGVALPRGSRAADLIDQLSQLGVDRLLPLITDHSASNGSSFRRDRLERAAVTAGKQSGRDWLMTIAEPMALFDAINGFTPCEGDADSFEVATTSSPRILALDPLGETMIIPAESDRNVCLLIGPEGGWSAAELQTMDQVTATGVDLKRWRLPTPILRVETAAVAATALIAARADWRGGR